MGKDYKDTLLMMKTDFSMRANLPEKEPLLQKRWFENNIYEKVCDKNKDKTPFILHDGPPYANGAIHCGHALNKILKDFIVRYKTMNGYYAPFIPGWDTHGLPIENALTKNSKVNRKEMSVSNFRKLCEEYALKQVDIQKEGFKRLGILGDWDHPYITLTKDFEAEQIKVFGRMVERGLIYKGLKPVFWSPSSESALAEAEIEYHDVSSKSIYLAFKVCDGKGVLDENCELVIWTTTPWTIPANLAVSVNGAFEYVVLNTQNRNFVVAKELVENFCNTCGYEEYRIVKTINGNELEYVTYLHPLNGKVCPVICGDHVTLESGTGLVHTAPGHGADDFIVGKKYGIEILCPVDSRGCMTSEAGEFEGLFYEKANDVIIERLTEVNSLLKQNTIVHSYPHDWRTKKPIIFRATPQWFASIDGLKAEMMESIKDVKWKPVWGETRLGNMVKDREEWCISRQRVWGVPIPVFYAEDGTEILDSEVINHVSDLFAEYGSNVWFEREAKDLLPSGYTHPGSPNGQFRKETDIMDVWFDSGSSHHAAMIKRGLPYPADLYLEGSDQYRGWFNSSLSTGVAMKGVAPYKEVVSHGFILDGEGRKMSKSLGNTVDPIQMVKEFGADIFRLWVASVEYTADVRISKDMVKQCAEVYRKIRNTFRFLIGNLNDFDNSKDRIAYENMPEVDQYMEVLLSELITKVKAAYDEYEFAEVSRLIVNYITNDLSSFYLDFTKDILYIDSMDSLARRSIQTAFYDNLLALTKLLTPLIPHTCEEVYGYIKGCELESVYLEDMPQANTYPNGQELLEKYSKVMALRTDVLKALEEARNNKVIGKSLSSKVTLLPSADVKALLSQINVDLKQIFIVSEFVVTDSEIEGYKCDSGVINVCAREGVICSRCWQVVDSVDEDELCERCKKIVKKMEA